MMVSIVENYKTKTLLSEKRINSIFPGGRDNFGLKK
jgi:hypothetical protein